jgi:hypothetical protein
MREAFARRLCQSNIKVGIDIHNFRFQLNSIRQRAEHSFFAARQMRLWR